MPVIILTYEKAVCKSAFNFFTRLTENTEVLIQIEK